MSVELKNIGSVRDVAAGPRPTMGEAAQDSDVFIQAVGALANDPGRLQAALKDLFTRRLVESYTRRIALAEEASQLDSLIASDEAALSGLDGTAAPKSSGKPAGLMDRALALLPALQTAVATNPTVAQAFGVIDSRSGGMLSQLLAQPAAE